MSRLLTTWFLVVSLLPLTCGCGALDRLDIMITQLDDVRCQLYKLDETNHELRAMRHLRRLDVLGRDQPDGLRDV